MLYCSGDQATSRISVGPRSDSVCKGSFTRLVDVHLDSFEPRGDLVATETDGTCWLPSGLVSIFREGPFLLFDISILPAVGHFRS